MSRHDELRATWKPGQVWETRIEECAADPNAWVPVAGGGRMEPLWDERQEYRQKPAAAPEEQAYRIQCRDGKRCQRNCTFDGVCEREAGLTVARPADVPSIYDVVPPPARIWLESHEPVAWAASRDWHAGWDACRTRCRTLLDAHLQRGREAAAPATPPDAWVWTDRQQKVIRFALWGFANAARAQANDAAQDRDGSRYKPGAVDAFLNDARDAEQILTIMRAEGAPSRSTYYCPECGVMEGNWHRLPCGQPRYLVRRPDGEDAPDGAQR